MDYYESERAVAEYLLFHYGTHAQVLGKWTGPTDALDYPARCVREAVHELPPLEQGRALDVGCSVGRSSFELARIYGEVIGIDRSARFIAAAQELQRAGQQTVDRAEEGHRTTRCTISVPDEIDRSRVQFQTGDAMHLPERLGHFDLVFAANLLDRLPEPVRFLERCRTLVKPGGRLALSSPYTWLEEYTPLGNWLGGKSGSTTTTAEVIAAHLEPNFTLTRQVDLPFLLREHARKYQWSVAEMLVFTRKG